MFGQTENGGRNNGASESEFNDLCPFAHCIKKLDASHSVFDIEGMQHALTDKHFMFAPQEVVSKAKDLSKSLRNSLNKHYGNAVDWAASRLEDEEQVKILIEYLEAIVNEDIPTSKLEAASIKLKGGLRQHELNKFDRPTTAQSGTLFSADY